MYTLSFRRQGLNPHCSLGEDANDDDDDVLMMILFCLFCDAWTPGSVCDALSMMVSSSTTTLTKNRDKPLGYTGAREGTEKQLLIRDTPQDASQARGKLLAGERKIVFVRWPRAEPGDTELGQSSAQRAKAGATLPTA